MRGTAVLLLVLVVLTPATGSAAAVGGSAWTGTTPENETASNASDTSEEQRLRDRISDLKDKNSRLKTKIVELEGTIQKLEFRLNQSKKDTGFSVDQAKRMKEMGAWNPHENHPAMLIVLDHGFGPVVYQYVGPGNGDESFNGMDAWTEVAKPEQKVRKIGSFTFSLTWTLPGMQTTYNVSSFTEYRVTNKKLKTKLNTPAGFTAWARWNNKQRQGAETFRGGTLIAGLGFALLVGGAAAWMESRSGYVLSLRQNRKLADQGHKVSGVTQSSKVERVKEWIRGLR